MGTLNSPISGQKIIIIIYVNIFEDTMQKFTL